MKVRTLHVLAAAIVVVPVLILAVPTTGSRNLKPRMPSQDDAPLHKKEANNLRSGKICFERGTWIYVKDLASRKETKLVEGINPRISPSGESVVFLSITEKDDPLNRVFLPRG